MVSTPRRTGDVGEDQTPETYTVLLTDVTPINSTTTTYLEPRGDSGTRLRKTFSISAAPPGSSGTAGRTPCGCLLVSFKHTAQGRDQPSALPAAAWRLGHSSRPLCVLNLTLRSRPEALLVPSSGVLVPESHSWVRRHRRAPSVRTARLIRRRFSVAGSQKAGPGAARPWVGHHRGNASLSPPPRSPSSVLRSLRPAARSPAWNPFVFNRWGSQESAGDKKSA